MLCFTKGKFDFADLTDFADPTSFIDHMSFKQTQAKNISSEKIRYSIDSVS